MIETKINPAFERDFYWINPQSVVIPKGKLKRNEICVCTAVIILKLSWNFISDRKIEDNKMKRQDESRADWHEESLDEPLDESVSARRTKTLFQS